jgi:1-acyl-sn-glycerol-3-phosphate acyltransferase
MSRVRDEFIRFRQIVRMLALVYYFHVFKLIGNRIDAEEGVIEQQIARLMSRAILRHLRAEIVVEGEEHLRGLEDYAVVSNHLSYLDWVLLLADFPRPISFIAKKEVTYFPVLGSYLRNRGLLIDRKKGVTARTVIARAAESWPWPLLIFPEGTRSPDGELQKFRRGGVQVLATAGKKLLPVVLLGTYDAFSREDRWMKYDHRLGVLILEPVDPAEHGVDAALKLVEARIRKVFEERRHEFVKKAD